MPKPEPFATARSATSPRERRSQAGTLLEVAGRGILAAGAIPVWYHSLNCILRPTEAAYGRSRPSRSRSFAACRRRCGRAATSAVCQGAPESPHNVKTAESLRLRARKMLLSRRLRQRCERRGKCCSTCPSRSRLQTQRRSRDVDHLSCCAKSAHPNWRRPVCGMPMHLTTAARRGIRSVHRARRRRSRKPALPLYTRRSIGSREQFCTSHHHQGGAKP